MLGGFLVDHYSWVWAFLVNVPLAIVALAITWLRVPESRGASAAGGLDAWGALLATLALGGIVYAFIEAPIQHWGSPAVLAALLVGVAAAMVFIVVERRARSPMLPLQLFRIRNFSGANLLTLLLYAALGGGLYFFPLNLIQVQDYTATAAGAALLPFILIMFVLSRWAGSLVDRFGSKWPLVVGPVTAAAGFALFALPGIEADYWLAFFPAVLVLGIGMTVTVAPLTTTVMNSVGPDVAGIASGVNNAVSRTAALLAIAIFGMVMAWAFETVLHERLREAGVSQEISAFLDGQRGRLAGAALPPRCGRHRCIGAQAHRKAFLRVRLSLDHAAECGPRALERARRLGFGRPTTARTFMSFSSLIHRSRAIVHDAGETLGAGPFRQH